MAAMSPTLTHTVEDRASAVGLSLARLARQADVSYRRVFENRLDREELDRVERILVAHESAIVGDNT
jgi:hypothetical protein